jgi:hypothetical protein
VKDRFFGHLDKIAPMANHKIELRNSLILVCD